MLDIANEFDTFEIRTYFFSQPFLVFPNNSISVHESQPGIIAEIV